MCKSNNCRSNNVRSAAKPGLKRARRRVEDRFRFWSFRLYYRRCFASEPNRQSRFLKALMASCRPIRDRRLLCEWYRQQQRRYRRAEVPGLEDDILCSQS